jgi:choline dehydrogenase-like flavoprotein
VSHQSGTCGFGTDPKQSVLDINCKHTTSRIFYVVDASFFPSCGAVNRLLTVIANAIRVAHLLADRLT